MSTVDAQTGLEPTKVYTTDDAASAEQAHHDDIYKPQVAPISGGPPINPNSQPKTILLEKPATASSLDNQKNISE